MAAPARVLVQLDPSRSVLSTGTRTRAYHDTAGYQGVTVNLASATLVPTDGGFLVEKVTDTDGRLREPVLVHLYKWHPRRPVSYNVPNMNLVLAEDTGYEFAQAQPTNDGARVLVTATTASVTQTRLSEGVRGEKHLIAPLAVRVALLLVVSDVGGAGDAAQPVQAAQPAQPAQPSAAFDIQSHKLRIKVSLQYADAYELDNDAVYVQRIDGQNIFYYEPDERDPTPWLDIDEDRRRRIVSSKVGLRSAGSLMEIDRSRRRAGGLVEQLHIQDGSGTD